MHHVYFMHFVRYFACEILYVLVVRHDLCFMMVSFMSCVWLILLCFHVFTLVSYEPYVVVSCCTHLTYLDAGY